MTLLLTHIRPTTDDASPRAGASGTGADNLFLSSSFIPHDDLPLITGYCRDEDIITLEYTPRFTASDHEIDPGLSFAPTADGQCTVILLGGVAQARVVGVTDLTADDVALMATDLTGPA